MNIKKIMATLAAFLPPTIWAQTEVSPYMPGQETDAVTYFLPRTVIEIEVEADKVTYTPGEFCKYAERYLRLKGVSNEEETHWELRKIEVRPVGVPDPEQAYSVKLKDKTIAPLMDLTTDGIIRSINKPAQQKAPSKPEEPTTEKRKINPRDLMTEEMLMASSSAKTAELVAKEIYTIRESKNAILRGQADNMPKDGEAMKLVLNSLDEQEAAMLEMFSGITVREKKVFTLRLVPNRDLVKEVLFRFSTRLGVLAEDDLGGSPVYVSLTNLNTVPQPDEKAKSGKKKLEGIVYNIPGKAQLRIHSGTTTYFDNSVLVTQFGNQETLSSDLFNKKATTEVTFDPVTGGLLKIERGRD